MYMCVIAGFCRSSTTVYTYTRSMGKYENMGALRFLRLVSENGFYDLKVLPSSFLATAFGTIAQRNSMIFPSAYYDALIH